MRSGPSMVIEGYASLFGHVDRGGDVVMRGAFADCLAKGGPQSIRMLFQHDPGQPVGVWTEILEDARGLRVRGVLAESVARAGEIAGLVEMGALDGLSIGFRTVKAARDRRAGVRQLVAVDLWEISIVTFPLLPEARLAGGAVARMRAAARAMGA